MSWQKHNIDLNAADNYDEVEAKGLKIPNDDYDEDDELDERVAAWEKKQKDRIQRGGFFGTQ